MEHIKVYKPPGGVSQVEAFIEGLEPKLREKVIWQIFHLSRTPPSGLKEPHYKHFSIEKYRDFYELREKNRIVVRIIFTLRPDGEILLLHAFQKRQSRDTMTALERSLKLLSLPRDHPEHAVEYKVNGAAHQSGAAGERKGGLLLDRMGLSVKSGWYDKSGRVYIYYTLAEIQENLNCGHDKATKLLVELDTKTGCGLIERVKQGQGRPAKIYVKRFITGGRSL